MVSKSKKTAVKQPKKTATKTTRKVSAEKRSGVSVDNDWRAQQDAQTLIASKEISSDKSRMAKAKAVLQKQLAATQNALKSAGSATGGKKNG